MELHHALAGVAVAFLVYILLQVRPRAGARRGLASEVRAARDRAHAATTPRARAEALCQAGAAAAHGGRWTSAAGFFLRAMRADPTWAGAVDATVASLAKPRPRLVEKLLWRRLSAVPWDDEHRAVAHTTATALAALYRRKLKDPSRATVLARLADKV